MKMTYDPEADAVGLRLVEGGDYYESAEVALGVVLDFDREGRVIGMEFLPASKVLAPGDWSTGPLPSGEAEDAPGRHAAE